ncbi:glycerophosphodiester phosphodiesterase [Jiangella ureilytica]|uniref:Glycerophosphodiester phosphodiesterase n=1 Tax=Jiangella ureilytica TaxID=2530374 RepID=A0A4R4RRR2_9ACTN|nr:glycerophosphodiester phosphodiesterase family protein [Jiangella ureilytica]TDC52264.1 glycerophosphodiester phosphodiesterase [Jiangella ureilytica]
MPGPHPYLDRPGPLALAHRGFSLDGLENSMAAFAAAVDLGYGYVETDVHATADGVAVALHDATLDRVTDRTGAVAALPWAEVRRALIGGVEPVPALEDVLGSWPDLRVNIDVKSAGAVVPLARVLDRTRAHDRVCVASFSDARRRAVVRRVASPVATSAGQALIAAFVGAASTPGARRFAASVLRGVDCLQVPATFRGRTVVTTATVAAAHAAGRQVHVWTVNEPAEMRRLLDLGVDGIITDRADLLRDVLESRGQWDPPS